MKQIFGSLCIAVALTACSEDVDSKYQDKGSVIVEIDGPEPENSIEELVSAAGTEPRDFSGVWQATIKEYHNNTFNDYLVKIKFQKIDDVWRATIYDDQLDEDPSNYHDIIRIENIQYSPPLLTFEHYPGHTDMDGNEMFFLAEMVVSDSDIKGIYKQAVGEAGGQTYYSISDAFLTRIE